MKAWTLQQLWLADELCFPVDFEGMAQELIPDTWPIKVMDFKRAGGLLAWMRKSSRADMDRGFGEIFDKMITQLLEP